MDSYIQFTGSFEFACQRMNTEPSVNLKIHHKWNQQLQI